MNEQNGVYWLCTSSHTWTFGAYHRIINNTFFCQPFWGAGSSDETGLGLKLYCSVNWRTRRYLLQNATIIFSFHCFKELLPRCVFGICQHEQWHLLRSLALLLPVGQVPHLKQLDFWVFLQPLSRNVQQCLQISLRRVNGRDDSIRFINKAVFLYTVKNCVDLFLAPLPSVMGGTVFFEPKHSVSRYHKKGGMSQYSHVWVGPSQQLYGTSNT